MKLVNLIKESFLGVLPSERNMIKMKHNPLSEISAAEVDAEMEAAQAEMDAAKAKAKAAKEAEKDTIKSAKDKMKAAKANLKVATESHEAGGGYTFGTGDVINNTNPGCVHYGSKGIVIQIPSKGMVRYSVTNSGDTYKPGDILTKTSDQLEKI